MSVPADFLDPLYSSSELKVWDLAPMMLPMVVCSSPIVSKSPAPSPSMTQNLSFWVFSKKKLRFKEVSKSGVIIVLDLLCCANLNPRALLVLLVDKTLGIGLGQDVFVFELSGGNVQIHLHGERVCVVYHLSVS